MNAFDLLTSMAVARGFRVKRIERIPLLGKLLLYRRMGNILIDSEYGNTWLAGPRDKAPSLQKILYILVGKP